MPLVKNFADGWTLTADKHNPTALDPVLKQLLALVNAACCDLNQKHALRDPRMYNELLSSMSVPGQISVFEAHI